MAQDRPAAVSVYKEIEQTQLSLTSSFTFQCHQGLACFNRCCRTPTVILSPYDILRLRQFLRITSGEFLERYTRQQTEARSNLPLSFWTLLRPPSPAARFWRTRAARSTASGPRPAASFP